MKRVYELEFYKLSEELSDLVWYDFTSKPAMNENANF